MLVISSNNNCDIFSCVGNAIGIVIIYDASIKPVGNFGCSAFFNFQLKPFPFNITIQDLNPIFWAFGIRV